MVSEDARSRICVPLDVSSLRDVGRHIRNLYRDVGFFKLGLQVIHRVGTPRIAQYIRQLEEELETDIDDFCDAKVPDIPNTTEEAVEAIVDLGFNFVNVHAGIGPKAIEAAAKKKGNSKLLVVTVLTSLTPKDLYNMYTQHYPGAKPFAQLSPEDQTKYLEDVVLGMAIMSSECGADGVICSPLELDVLSQDAGLNGFLRYTPGIRPEWAKKNDQERITTPGDAIRKGATGIIVGRPILQPPKSIGKPVDAARLIGEEIDEALMALA